MPAADSRPRRRKTGYRGGGLGRRHGRHSAGPRKHGSVLGGGRHVTGAPRGVAGWPRVSRCLRPTEAPALSAAIPGWFGRRHFCSGVLLRTEQCHMGKLTVV